MNNYDIQEAAAAVAANHKMSSRDMMDILCFALSMMSVFALTVVIV